MGGRFRPGLVLGPDRAGSGGGGAIGDAVFAALGVRVRDLPITFQRIVDAINA
jgi:hypothetical protein